MRGTETILGNREYKKTKLEETEEQANLFQRNKKTCTPSPLRGLCILLRRQNTTKVMAYNVTLLLEIRHCNTSNGVQTNAIA